MRECVKVFKVYY